MTKDEQLQANLIIAKALGLKAECSSCKGKGYIIPIIPDVYGIQPKQACYTCMGRGEIDYKVDIFTTPSDCQAAVIHLGNEHDIGIVPCGENRWGYCSKYQDLGTSLITGYDTYQEAVAAAYLALDDNESS